MPNITMNKTICLAGIILLSLSLTFCSTARPKVEPDQEIQEPLNIVILPAEPADNTVPELVEGAAKMTDILTEFYKNDLHIRVITQKQKETFAAGVMADRLKIARAVGRELKSDAVVFSVVSRYRDRVGTQYAADAPSSVAFDSKLFLVESGRVLCSPEFNETQKPLTENVLKLGKAIDRGFTWVNAEQLLREGIKNSFSKCPYLEL